MKANKYKCHLIVSDNRHVFIKIDFTEIENRECQKLLGIKSDQNAILRITWMKLLRKSVVK